MNSRPSRLFGRLTLAAGTLSCAAVGVALALTAEAATILIDFDSLPGMINIPGTIVPLANQLSDQFLTTLGVSFRSQAGYVAVAVHGAPTISPPNLIGGVKLDGTLSYGTPITVSFFVPTDPSTKAVTDFVSVRGDPIAVPASTATMEAFDVFGQSLGLVVADDINGGLTLSIAAPGIHSVLLTQSSSGGGIYDGTIGLDNFEFNAPVQVTGVEDRTVPAGAVLLSNAVPNPFNPQTRIQYAVPSDMNVRISIYDVRGNTVRTLVDDRASGGIWHSVSWDGRTDRGDVVASGTYFCKLITLGETQTRKMTLLK